MEMEKIYVHDTYDAIAKQFHNTRYNHWNAVKLFIDKIPKYGILADVGCGNGKYSTYRKDIVYLGCDVCLPLLNVGYSKDVLLANGLNLPYQNKTFDAVMSIAVLHHLFDLKKRIKFIQELLRISRGCIMITVWAYEQDKKKTWMDIGNGDFLIPWGKSKWRYYHLFTKAEVEELMLKCNITNYVLFFEKDNWCIVIQ